MPQETFPNNYYINSRTLILSYKMLPVTCAAAWDVPLFDVKQVLQSLEAPIISSPGANTSTQRPKLVPKVPMEAG